MKAVKKAKYGKKLPKAMYGKRLPKAKKGLTDLSGDGQVTKKDLLMKIGVVPKPGQKKKAKK